MLTKSIRNATCCGMFLVLICFLPVANIFAQEDEPPSFFFLSFGHNFINLDDVFIHNPTAGMGFTFGEQDLPFDQVERRFFGQALYRPFFFDHEPVAGTSTHFHQIDLAFHGRINHHKLLFNAVSISDEPIVGGMGTFLVVAGWGYEIVRRPNMQLILGASVAVPSLFHPIIIFLPPLWPILVRLDLDVGWLAGHFEFHSGPAMNGSFTVGPRSRIRFTGSMEVASEMRSALELALWYRPINENRRFGIFSGIGLGTRSVTTRFAIPGYDYPPGANRGWFSYRMDFAVSPLPFIALDLSFLQIEGGWITHSSVHMYRVDYRDFNGGFFVSVLYTLHINR